MRTGDGDVSQLCLTPRQQLDVSVGMLLGCYSDKGEEGRPTKRTIRSLTNVTVGSFWKLVETEFYYLMNYFLYPKLSYED
jgi:hypothetical protein